MNILKRHTTSAEEKSVPKSRRPLWNRRWFRAISVIVGIAVSWWIVMFFSVSRPLFDVPYSTLLYSRDNALVGARVAKDGQWRFPEVDSLPRKFVECIVAYEDKRFFRHPGVDPLAIGRAIRLNSSRNRVVSGGSTLTMQLARIARGNKERTLWQKFVEVNEALFLETIYGKQKILKLYASHAPFGGNIVGVQTAAWRYFGRGIHDLSWAECATLAVLPNSPALIHPGRNREALQRKRNDLLARLYRNGIIDASEYELALLEPLPEKPHSLPNDAPHLMERLAAERTGDIIKTALERSLQIRVQNIVNSYGSENSSRQINNMAAIVADVETGEVLAYVGNVTFDADSRHGNHVDVINAPRSTGSILKPLLYAAMLTDGMILPKTLVSDTPLNINGFMPHNYNRQFHGAVPVGEAITRSLNVPLVRMLSAYNTGRFMSLLKSYGMTTLAFSEEHYGASIILGGAEGTLWDMAGMYASMARVLSHYARYSGRYDKTDVHPLVSLLSETKSDPIVAANDPRLSDDPLLSASAIWYAFEAMSELNRPEEEADWQQFNSMKRVAWKTGTSYGGRDGWAIGTTSKNVVGVWVGNASGEGRAGLTGVGYAAPVMFDIFSLLQNSDWFEMPYGDMEKSAVCGMSGHRASDLCSPVDSLYIPAVGIATAVCPYHKLVHLSTDGQWQVNSSCESVANIRTTGWFVLPPAQEYYFRNFHPDYKLLPPMKPGCRQAEQRSIDIIYPEHNATVVVPRGMSGEYEKVVFNAAHARENATIFWYIDEDYIATTRDEHQIAVLPSEGRHILLLVDNEGNRRSISFTVRAANDKQGR